VVHLFRGIFNLEPRAVNMLQASHHLNPALRMGSKICFIPLTRHLGLNYTNPWTLLLRQL